MRYVQYDANRGFFVCVRPAAWSMPVLCLRAQREYEVRGWYLSIPPVCSCGITYFVRFIYHLQIDVPSGTITIG